MFFVACIVNTTVCITDFLSVLQIFFICITDFFICITDFLSVLQIFYLYYRFFICITDFLSVLQILYLYYRCCFLYCRCCFICITDFLSVLQIFYLYYRCCFLYCRCCSFCITDVFFCIADVFSVVQMFFLYYRCFSVLQICCLYYILSRSMCLLFQSGSLQKGQMQYRSVPGHHVVRAQVLHLLQCSQACMRCHKWIMGPRKRPSLSTSGESKSKSAKAEGLYQSTRLKSLKKQARARMRTQARLTT